MQTCASTTETLTSGEWLRGVGLREKHSSRGLRPLPDLRWLDVGCGTGSFAALISERCAPIEIQGIDPSEGQLAIARMRAGHA